MGANDTGVRAKVLLSELDSGNCIVFHARCAGLPDHAYLKISTQGWKHGHLTDSL
jgi:hypothetical protein